MTNIDLLNRVLAEDGWYAVLGIKGKSVIQKLVQTREEVIETSEKFVAEKRDVYFGCSKFETSDNRTKDNVKAIKAFWIDLDCGVSKAEVNEKTGRPDGYIDQATALQEFKKFCQTVGLPKPILVNSGRGIHAYWPLSAPVTRAEWEPVANRLNELCVIQKLYVDASVFEAARVLRIPGTFNFKDEPPKPVEVIDMSAGDVQYEDIKNILGVSEKAFQPKVTQELSELQKAMAANTTFKFGKIMMRSAKGEGCAQLLHCYQNQDSISEPLWFSALSIAHRCTDRETAIHKISDQHSDYSPEDTEAKASHTEFAHTCSTFEKHNPGGCEGCPWKGRIKSPINLGREVVKAEDTEVEEEESEGVMSLSIPSYPNPYFRGGNGGVYIQSQEEEEEAKCVYEHDLYVVKRMKDPDPEIGEVVLMRVHLPADGIRDFIIPLAIVGSKDRLREALATNGVLGYKKQNDLITHYVMTFVKTLQYKKKAELMRTQFGWADKNSKFIIGDREVSKDGIFHSPPSAATKQFADHMHPMGTLEKWKEVFNLYSAPGLEPHAFAALTAFGAPLLKFTGHSGAIINLIHKESGTGKSTALYMCNSVYGHPDKLAAIWKDTLAAKMIHLGVMNNLPFTVDEITNISPADFSTLAYSMSQGRGANRSKSSANELRTNTTTWQTMSLASSNASFYEKLGVHKNSPDGEMMRLLEYRIHPTNIIPAQIAKQMFDHQLKENYGHAGDIYCSYLVNELEEAIGGVRAVQARIDQEMKLTNRERFWSALIACNLTGGIIARNLGLINYDMKAIYNWAMTMLTEVRQEIAPPTNNAGSVIGDFMNRHMRSMLVVNDEVDKRTKMHSVPLQEPYSNELVMRYEPDTRKLFIVASSFKAYCVEFQVGYRDTLTELGKNGSYVKAGNKRMSKGMRITSPGVHALEFDCTIPDFIDIEGIVEAAKENANREDKLQD